MKKKRKELRKGGRWEGDWGRVKERKKRKKKVRASWLGHRPWAFSDAPAKPSTTAYYFFLLVFTTCTLRSHNRTTNYSTHPQTTLMSLILWVNIGTTVIKSFVMFPK